MHCEDVVRDLDHAEDKVKKYNAALEKYGRFAALRDCHISIAFPPEYYRMELKDDLARISQDGLKALIGDITSLEEFDTINYVCALGDFADQRQAELDKLIDPEVAIYNIPPKNKPIDYFLEPGTFDRLIANGVTEWTDSDEELDK